MDEGCESSKLGNGATICESGTVAAGKSTKARVVSLYGANLVAASSARFAVS